MERYDVTLFTDGGTVKFTAKSIDEAQKEVDRKKKHTKINGFRIFEVRMKSKKKKKIIKEYDRRDEDEDIFQDY